jgi:hypothetical protein
MVGGGGVANRIKDNDAGRSTEGVIQKVKYIMEGRERNEVLRGRGFKILSLDWGCLKRSIQSLPNTRKARDWIQPR